MRVNFDLEKPDPSFVLPKIFVGLSSDTYAEF